MANLEVTVCEGAISDVSTTTSPLAATKLWPSLILGFVLIALGCFAQQQPSTHSQTQPQVPADSPSQAQSSATADHATLTLPAGTKITLVLTHQLVSRSIHRGDDVYAQTTFPVTTGSQVAIPPGAFVQGKIEKLARKGNRGELQMQSTSVVFPNGYVASVAGPAKMEGEEGTALRDPSNGAKAGAMAALGAPMAGALIGAASSGTYSRAAGAAIGGGVGLGVGVVTALVLLTQGNHFAMDVGAPMDMVLQQPLTLDKGQVDEAIREARDHPAPPPAVATRPGFPSTVMGTCYTVGTPGTPPTFIPGTPAIGNMPGTPGTVIPGTPPTPGTPYPCPQ